MPDESDLCSKPEETGHAYGRVNAVSHNFTIAAAFGNVHGVYKPGNVKLRPRILRDGQRYVHETFHTDSERPINFVFHGGSGSTPDGIAEAISCGVGKMNIDTDLQWAFWDGSGDTRPTTTTTISRANSPTPDGADAPNNRQYDPRTRLRSAEESFAPRLRQSFEELGNVGALC